MRVLFMAMALLWTLDSFAQGSAGISAAIGTDGLIHKLGDESATMWVLLVNETDEPLDIGKPDAALVLDGKPVLGELARAFLGGGAQEPLAPGAHRQWGARISLFVKSPGLHSLSWKGRGFSSNEARFLMLPAENAKDALPRDFPPAEAIRKLWSERAPGVAGALQIGAPASVSAASPEGKAVRAALSLLQRPRLRGIWRVGRRVMAGTKDIRPPDAKGQNNSVSNYSVCYVARLPDGYRLIEAAEVWKWGQSPSFGRARILGKFD